MYFNLTTDLLSENKVTQGGFSILFDADYARIFNPETEEIIAIAK